MRTNALRKLAFLGGISITSVCWAANTVASVPNVPVVDAGQEPLCRDGLDGVTHVNEARDGTNMVGLRSCWLAQTNNADYRLLNDLYAQWTIERVDLGKENEREYFRESKPAIFRFFIGQNQSFVSSLRIDMHDPDLTFVMPLATFGYSGRVGKGENWVTDIVSDDQSQPLFRVGPSTSATFVLTAKSSRDLEIRASGTVLTALRSVASLVSPGGSVVNLAQCQFAASSGHRRRQCDQRYLG